jgi:haloalkane dehalogenase
MTRKRPNKGILRFLSDSSNKPRRQQTTRRRPSVESLESRVLLAADFAQNPDYPEDVNTDGVVSRLDATVVLNHLNDSSPHSASTGEKVFLDVNGDCSLSPIDALLVINQLNSDSGESGAPVELTPCLCEDPSSLALLGDLGGVVGGGPSYGDVNTEQIQRMLQSPTDGPFYMVNLIRFRDEAVYPDGRETELTGREANDLYNAGEFIEAIGGQPVFVGEVAGTTLGEEGKWDQVAIVEYPCPAAFFAMSAHPEFQETSIHKNAGVEESTVMVTYLDPLEGNGDVDSSTPGTGMGPSLATVQVFNYNEEAQYGDSANEPSRTGEEAMEYYADLTEEVGESLGISPTARLSVEGVFIGGGADWDEVWIDYVPSSTALAAYSTDPAVLAAQYHRDAAIEDAYGMVVGTGLSNFPTSEDSNDGDTGITSEETYTIDNTAPTVAISRHNPTDEHTNADTVAFLLNFSEDVTNVTADDFEVAASGVVTGAITVGDNGDSDESTYTVSIASVSGDGLLDLNFTSTQDIADRAGNPFSSGPSTGDENGDDEARVGYEILQVISPTEIITWMNNDQITQEEFDAIELPQGWFKNQPREGTADSAMFAGSPGSTSGEFVVAEHFGHEWRHVATIVEANVPLDDDQLLTANTITKSHELTFDAETTLPILISPEDEHYVLVSRDAGRTSDIPTIPEGWQLVEYTTTEELVVQLPDPTINIRADNEDSFQGPVPELAALINNDDPGDDDAVILTTDDGVEFVRTPDEYFDSLPDWPYEPKYVEIDGLRQAYVDEGPEDGPVVLLLHGQPTWSYLYRDMIPVLADAGYRVIAMDHLGMGRSDKPIDIESYSYNGHTERLEQFIAELELTDINVFVQDWGSIIGLRVAGENPDLFSSITVGNGTLAVAPAGYQIFPPVENPNEIADIPSPFAGIPPQQIPFYDAGSPTGANPLAGDYFADWATFAMKGESFSPSEMVEQLTWFDVPADEAAAYDAPFPSRTYMAGARVFPSLANEVPGETDAAWAGLTSYEDPFLTLWGANDPGQMGPPQVQQRLISAVPGAEGQPHDRLPEASHYLQDDQGEEIANRLIDFYELNGLGPDEAFNDEVRVGYEILQLISPNEIVTWASFGDITQEEFDAIELPQGWFKNQPREGTADSSMFAGSPGAAPGELVTAEHFGHEWRHVATIVEADVPLDDDQLLTANTITKSHELTFDAETTLPILISPEHEHYVLVSRDAGRTSDVPTIPEGWQLVEYRTTEELVVQLPNPTINIRADNEDSFQGPVPELAALISDGDPGDDDAVILTTDDGVEFVRTPDEYFHSLPDWPYEPQYVEIDGLRQAYVDEGPEDGPVVLLLHGQPSWSYLYRDMIPVLADAGYRVIAMDHLGMGRSDKPIDIESYSFLNHTYRLEQFIQELGLEDINLFAQDWGSIVGQHVAGLNPDWFATITIGNGSLPVFPEGVQPFPEVENPDAILPIPSPFANIPDQQVPFYDEDGNLLGERVDNSYFGFWINYAMTGESFQASEVLEALTWFPLPAEEEAAYDAPFPSRIYMAGPRSFPSLVNDLPGVNQASFEGLQSYEKPFLTIWGSNDAGAQGSLEAQQFLIDSVPGAEGQPHARLAEAGHFLQDDQGEEIATRLVAFYEANGILGSDPSADNGSDAVQVFYEILQVTPNGIIVWANNDGIIQGGFDAIELPQGWLKNQPREIVTDGTFANSPGVAPGEFVEEELFGYSWRHMATIVEANVPLDDDALLTANIISKSHQVTFDADSTLSILVSPEGEHYVLITRDAGRTSDTPTIPEGWQLVEHTLTEELVVQLPNPTINIRADNEDSFQGPVPELAALINNDEPSDDDAVILTTDDGVEFVRTPDEYFDSLPDWPYEPQYVEIDGLRQAYVDEGPEDGPVVLLLHGQPSWSYLYRDMIPVLAEAGYRVIAMDHLGMGRSDKPIDIESYSYNGHCDRLEQFIGELELSEINLFVQDWGSLIGLRVAGENPDLFSSITVGDGTLVVAPAGFQLFPPVENPNETVDIPSLFSDIPAQQVPYYNGCTPTDANALEDGYFANWMTYAMTAESFRASEVVEAMTWFDVPAAEEAAYDAPFPSRIYMAGARVFPSLANEVPGETDEAWAGLTSYEKPFLTLWASNDPGQLGSCEMQQRLINAVPGAEGQPHDRLSEASHFLQDDQGEEIARRLVEFYQANGIEGADPTAETDAEILSAYLGATDIPFPRLLEAVTGAEQQVGDDGMPVVFSVQIDASTLSPEDFAITTASGATTTPTVATLAPANESDELRTVLLAGPLGSANDLPVSVSVAGSLQSVDGQELRGLTSEVSTNENGPELVLAVLDPAETDVDGGETTPARVQTTWQGGVSGRFGRELGLRELRGFNLIDENGDAHRPVGFEDLGDEDNHVVLLVPEGVTPVRVEVRAGTLYDPTNQPNPDTSIEIVGTADLEEELDDPRFRDLIRDRVGSPLLPFRNVSERRGTVVGNAVRLRHAITHLNEAADHEHDRPSLPKGRGLRGPRDAMTRPSDRSQRLVPSEVDAAFQSGAFEDVTDLLLSRAVRQRSPNEVRGIDARFR